LPGGSLGGVAPTLLDSHWLLRSLIFEAVASAEAEPSGRVLTTGSHDAASFL
jgi:hypothetical protein